MTLVLTIQIFLLMVVCFMPVWLGGQAVTCYNEGNIFKSALCFGIGTIANVGLIAAILWAHKYSVALW